MKIQVITQEFITRTFHVEASSIKEAEEKVLSSVGRINRPELIETEESDEMLLLSEEIKDV